ncbi:MAG: preprotein translocase subunit SecG [Victivallales bacterium]|nr:preprotein translocase subunit SecG [Victivallales bacterium]
MYTFFVVLLTIVAVVSALLLIGIVLIQNNKSGGGLGAVSGGVTETMFGASASNMLIKGTVWIAVIFLVSTLLLAMVTGRGRSFSSAAEKYLEAPKALPAVVDNAVDTANAAADKAADTANAAADKAADTATAAADNAKDAAD